MPDVRQTQKGLRVTSVIASLRAGGIGSVCRYAAEGMAKSTDWQVTLLSLHDPRSEFTNEASGLRIVCLGLERNCAREFLNWLSANPQDLIVTSDVSRIEAAYPFIPSGTRHIVQVHDSGRRYREVAVRHAVWIDGVTCVGRHIEARLQRSLGGVGFRGLLGTVHNGADFPPVPNRIAYGGPLRLLFMGQVEALKGVFDFVPLLRRLKQLGVPVKLNLVGGENEALRRQFQRKGLEDMVAWAGLVPHAKCYGIAAESDLLLMPTRKESFGMVTIEAMSMGCVPIAYDIPSGSTEIIEHDRSGLLVSLGDLKQWAHQIYALHGDRKRLAELSAGAMARARSHFNAGVMARNMTAFLTEVVAHSRDHAPRREIGTPSQLQETERSSSWGYQRLPASLRGRIRNWVCTSPKLSYWLLSR